MTEDEMASLRGEWREGEKERWHHWFNGHEFEHAPGDDEGQGSLVCCNPRSGKESDVTEALNNNDNWL